MRSLKEWRGFLLFVLVMLMFRSAIADWNQVPSGSMKPSILIGDRILVNKMAYDLRVPFTLIRLARWSAPARGEIVTFESPDDGTLLVKRVIGVPGDVVTLDDNRLTINGEAARYEPLGADVLPHGDHEHFEYFRETIDGVSQTVRFARRNRPSRYGTFGPVTVPDGHYLMLGDNRDQSGDFRDFGWVRRDAVLGRAHTVAFSLDYDHYFAPRADRFFVALE